MRTSIAIFLLLVLVLASLTVLPSSDEVYFVKDDFDGKISYFFEGHAGGASFKYLRDELAYEIDGLSSGGYNISALTDSFEGYEVSLQVQIMGASAGEVAFAGVAFFYREDIEKKASFHALLLFEDGFFGVSAIDEGSKVEYLVPLRKTELLSPRGLNEVRLVVLEGRGEIYINGTFAGEFRYEKGLSGGVGLLAGPFTRARFKAFRWRLLNHTTSPTYSGPFGLIPISGLKEVFRDYFNAQGWQTGKIDSASFRYLDGAYAIDNLRGGSSALSYQLGDFAKDGVLSAVFSDIEGSTANGFGIAFRLSKAEESLSYATFVLARDGTYRIVVQDGGVEKPLCEWRKIEPTLDFSEPIAITVAFLETEEGLEIAYGVNGRLLGDISTQESLPGVGFGILVAPGVSVKVRSMVLLSLEEAKKDFLKALQEWKVRQASSSPAKTTDAMQNQSQE